MWAEGGLVDSLDKKISLAFFRSEIGPLEFVLSVPGTWHGIPIFALFVIPLITSLCVAESHATTLFVQVVGTILAGALVVWFKMVHNSWSGQRDSSGGILPAYLPWGSHKLLVVLIVASCYIVLGLCHIPTSSRPRAAASFYICCYLQVQVVIDQMKKFFKRQRPCFVLQTELQAVKRHLPQVQVLLREMSPRASFPSGDVAGAAVFAGVCWTVTGSPEYLVAIAVSAFGRMYFHAHHFLDVLVGGLVGLAGTCFIGWCHAWVVFGWTHLLFSQVFFVAGYGLGSRLQKKMKHV